MFFDQLKRIKAFVFDVDGVLTDGTILVTESGEQLRRFNIKDGYAIQLAVKRGYHIAAISGGRSNGIRVRLEGLGVPDIFLGVHTKIDPYNEFLNKYGINKDEIVFIGDDIPDMPLISRVGLAVCPSDAVEEVKKACHYISPKNGGEGCVRDIIEKVMKLRGDWHDDFPSAHDGSLK